MGPIAPLSPSFAVAEADSASATGGRPARPNGSSEGRSNAPGTTGVRVTTSAAATKPALPAMPGDSLRRVKVCDLSLKTVDLLLAIPIINDQLVESSLILDQQSVQYSQRQPPYEQRKKPEARLLSTASATTAATPIPAPSNYADPESLQQHAVEFQPTARPWSATAPAEIRTD